MRAFTNADSERFDELPARRSQRVRYSLQVADRRIDYSSLDLAYIGSMQAAVEAERFLRKAAEPPEAANPLSDMALHIHIARQRKRTIFVDSLFISFRRLAGLVGVAPAARTPNR